MASKYFPNQEIPETFKWITVEEFVGIFFTYITKEKEYAQVFKEKREIMKGMFACYTYQFEYKGWESLAIGMARFDGTLCFYKIGKEEEWNKCIGLFAAQFQGDNS